MKKLALTTIMSALLIPMTAQALPNLDITTAKQALTAQKLKSAEGQQFKDMRVRDLPAFDRIGVGNYMVEYELDGRQKLMIFMYVESEPPMVDEVVLYVKPPRTVGRQDLKPSRALDLINIVYANSMIGGFVVKDFRDAVAKPKPVKKVDGEYSIPTFEFNSRLPLSYDGGLYYLGARFGYKVSLHKGGFQVEIKRRDVFSKWLDEKSDKMAPMEVIPTPIPEPTPLPEPTIIPDIRW